MELMCQDIHFGIGEKKILKGVSLKLEGDQFHTILGQWKWKDQLAETLLSTGKSLIRA